MTHVSPLTAQRRLLMVAAGLLLAAALYLAGDFVSTASAACPDTGGQYANPSCPAPGENEPAGGGGAGEGGELPFTGYPVTPLVLLLLLLLLAGATIRTYLAAHDRLRAQRPTGFILG